MRCGIVSADDARAREVALLRPVCGLLGFLGFSQLNTDGRVATILYTYHQGYLLSWLSKRSLTVSLGAK